MRIVIPGIDASQSGLGRSAPLIHGMPADGLQALYFYNSGIVGQPVSTFPDLSGRNNHATLYGAYTAPVQREWGLEVQSVNGLLLSTGVPLGPQSTVVLAVETLLPGSESGVYETFFTPSSNNLPTDPAARANYSISPTINFNGSVPSSNGNYAIFDFSQATLGTGRPGIPGGTMRANQPAALALRIDSAASTIRLRGNLGTELAITRPEIGAHYAAGQGTVLLGAGQYTTARTVATPNARLYGAAIYNRVLTDDETVRAMRAVRRPAERAGIVFAT